MIILIIECRYDLEDTASVVYTVGFRFEYDN